MKNYIHDISFFIQKELSRGRKKFILYPFGKQGELTKKILNNNFGIQELFIIDNFKKSNKVYPLEYLKEYELTDKYVLVTSDREEIYSEIRDQLRKYVPEKNILDIFEKIDNSAYYSQLAEILKFDKNNNICTLENYGVKFYLPFWKSDFIQKEILFNSRYYEDSYLFYATKVFKGKMRFKGKMILDIGANIGNHSIYFVKECGAAKVLSFEPIPKTFEILKRNIELNNLQNSIIPYNWGIGDMRSRASASDYDLTNIGGTFLRNVHNGEVEVHSIDEMNIDENVALIKIDVEGFEAKVIKGALKTIKKNMPMIMVEAWENSNTIFSIINMLCKFGYDFKQVDVDNYIFYEVKYE